MRVATGFPPVSTPRRSAPRHGARLSGGPAYAAVDLGTNNCRLLVAVPENPIPAKGPMSGRALFRVTDAFSRIVRLGEGLGQTGRLSEPAMARTIAALRVCASKLRRHHVVAARLVATEACRRAENCKEFLARVRAETGLSIEIITTQEEARLALNGCAPLLEAGKAHGLVFDIGGGSTQLNWLAVGADAVPQSIDAMSIPLGVATLGERYGGEHVAPDIYGEMVAEVARAIRPFEQRHGILEHVTAGTVQMLGTSGTVTTLARVHLGLARYDRSVVDGSYLSFDAVSAITRRLAGLGYHERAAHPCIGRERSDLVLAGCAILEAICRQWPTGRLRVADRGVREGILCGLIWAERSGAPRAATGAVTNVVDATR